MLKDEDRDLFIQEWYLDCDGYVIAEYLGISADTVYSRAYRLGLSRKRERKTGLTPDDTDLIIELNETLSIREIAFKFNITQKRCNLVIKNFGLHKTSKK